MRKRNEFSFAKEQVERVRKQVKEQTSDVSKFKKHHIEHHGCPAAAVVKSLFNLFDKEVTINEILQTEVANSYAAREILELFDKLNTLFETKFRDFDDLVTYLTDYVADFKDECANNDRLNIQVDKLNREVGEKTLQLRKLTTENIKLTKLTEQLQAEIRDMDSAINQLKVRDSDLKQQLRSERDANEELNHSNVRLSKKIEALRKDRDELRVSNTNLVSQRDRLRDQLFQLQETVDSIQYKIKEDERNASVALREVSSEKQQLRDEMSRVDAKSRRIKEKYRSAVAKIAEFEALTKDLECKLKQLMYENEQYEIQLRQAKDDTKLLQRQNTLQANKLNSRKTKTDELKHDLALAQSAASGFRSDLSTSCNKVEQLEAKYLASQKEVAALRAEAEGLRQANKVLEKQVEMHRGRMGEAKQDNDCLRDRIEEIEQKYLDTIAEMQDESQKYTRALEARIERLSAAPRSETRYPRYVESDSETLDDTSSEVFVPRRRENRRSCSGWHRQLHKEIVETKRIANTSSASNSEIIDCIHALENEVERLRQQVED